MTWTTPPKSSCQPAATSDPSALNEGPNTAPAPDALARRSPVEGSHTFKVPSSPVEASIEPSGLNATSLTSPSCPSNERMLCPVSPSLMSMTPESFTPSVTNTPVGLQSRSPPTPGTDITSRDATTARCSASSASGRTVPSADLVSSTAFVARRTLSSASVSTLATAAAASSLAVAILASRPARSL